MGKVSEEGDTADYFKNLFGNLTKGGLTLFSNKNPFQRKREDGLGQGSCVGEDGTRDQTKGKPNTENSGVCEERTKILKNEKNSEILGQQKSKSVVSDELNLNLGLGTKKKKSHSENDEANDVVKDDSVSTIKKNKKLKDDANIRCLGKKKIKTEDFGEDVQDLDRTTKNKKSYSENDGGTPKKKKKTKNKLKEEISDGARCFDSLDDEQAKLIFEVQTRNGRHSLLEKKRKESLPEDLAQIRKEKKRKIAVEENWQSAVEHQGDDVQEVMETKHLKRAHEQDKNQPSKRIKLHHQYHQSLAVAAETGLAVDAELKKRSITKLNVKSELGKRKRVAIEEEYEAQHVLGGDEKLSTEVESPKKVTGKRKWGSEAADMVVKKDSFDDEEKVERTIFIGNLPLNVKKKKLLREFSQFGEVESIRLRSIPILDTKLTRKGAIITGKINETINSVHAYVVFENAQSANAALSHNMTEFGGNHIRVDRARPPCKKHKGESHLIYDPKKTVFVGNLPFDVKDEELYQLFFGIKPLESSIEAIRVIRDSQTSMGKGIAYVLFKTMDAAKLAVKKNDLKLRDRSLRLSRVQPNSNARPQTTFTSRSKSDMTPKANVFSRKRHADSEMSNISSKKKSKASLSYQGTKASKTDKHPIKLTGSTSVHNPQVDESKPRVFKRVAVAARKAISSQSPGQNLAGKKRKRAERRTGYSKSPKKIRAH